VRALRKSAEVLDAAEEVRGLNDERGRLVVQRV
jgi:hypothetical protein